MDHWDSSPRTVPDPQSLGPPLFFIWGFTLFFESLFVGCISNTHIQSEDNLMESVLSFHMLVGFKALNPGHQTFK